MQHRASIGHLITGYVPMGEINFVKATDGCKLWHLENNKPDYGLSITYMDFGNPKVLGSSISLSPFIEIPLNSKQRASVPIVRVSWGLAYVTKKFDIKDNHKNIAIGTKLEVKRKFDFDRSIEVKIGRQPSITISEQLAKNIFVKYGT